MVRFHPAARDELLDSLQWYEERSPISAVAFTTDVEGALSSIAATPFRYPRALNGTRRFILRRFPFNIHYRVKSREILIVAIAHHKRRPGYWIGR